MMDWARLLRGEENIGNKNTSRHQRLALLLQTAKTLACAERALRAGGSPRPGGLLETVLERAPRIPGVAPEAQIRRHPPCGITRRVVIVFPSPFPLPTGVNIDGFEGGRGFTTSVSGQRPTRAANPRK